MLRLSFYAIAAVTIAVVGFFGAYRYAHTSAGTNTISAYDADVNGDGAVTIADPIAALNKIGQLATGARPVAEQNLDADGNIKVRDQRAGRVISIVTNQFVANGQNVSLGTYADVRDCHSIDAYVRATVSNNTASSSSQWITTSLEASLDGLTSFSTTSEPYFGSTPFPQLIIYSTTPNGQVVNGFWRVIWNAQSCCLTLPPSGSRPRRRLYGYTRRWLQQTQRSRRGCTALAFRNAAHEMGAARSPCDGKLGADVGVDQGRDAARGCAVSALAIARQAAGSLDNVARVVKLLVFVASADGFGDQPTVANGASDLLRDVFGDAGVAARSAVGVAELPLGASVEAEFIFELRDAA